MKIRFTKMQGAGNDFVVLDETQNRLNLSAAQYRFLADRRFGVGADQILSVRPGHGGADFEYVIHNADGGEVEQCGNGARCFARFVADKGLSSKQEIRVETARGVIVPRLLDSGLVMVNMGKPRLMPSEIPFVPAAGEADDALTHIVLVGLESVPLSCVNMGNPHAVLLVDDVDTAPVARWGEAIESNEQFPERVNVGFMQVLDEGHIRLRVYERGAGETQACGTGACAAVVAGVRLGLLQAASQIRVSLPGGDLHIEWQPGDDVMMTGPVQTVFEGELQY